MSTQNFNETDIRRDGDGRFASDPVDLEVTNMPAIELSAQ